jgi:hypothetical protein
MNSKLTVVIGASENPSRYSNMAVKKLKQYGYDVVGIGLREGMIDDVPIGKPNGKIEDVHTVSLYVGPRNQEAYFDYIVDLKPERLILNPGTYNPELLELLEKNGIEAIEACTLVMLSAGTY